MNSTAWATGCWANNSWASGSWVGGLLGSLVTMCPTMGVG